MDGTFGIASFGGMPAVLRFETVYLMPNASYAGYSASGALRYSAQPCGSGVAGRPSDCRPWAGKI